jgi:DNA-binding LacI/PurR family transcriptional regulator
MGNKPEQKKDIVYNLLLKRVLAGHAGERFPSEPELSKQLGVSRVTLRSALQRLAAQGLISRSHYYGTRIAATQTHNRRILVVHSATARDATTDFIFIILNAFEQHLRESGYSIEHTTYTFLQSMEKISQNFCGVLLFGAALNGWEPFIDTLRTSQLPVIYIREDHNCKVTSIFNSVGTDMRRAWWSGYEYLFSLGCNRIGTICGEDARNKQRLGYTCKELKNALKKAGSPESAKLVKTIAHKDFTSGLTRLVRDEHPDALYFYSDYLAAQSYTILKENSLKIPKDIAVLAFGSGSSLLTPSMSAVDLGYGHWGIAAAELLLHLINSPEQPPIHLSLPYTIDSKESTLCYKLKR